LSPEPTTHLFVPAAVVPVAAQIWLIVRHDYNVESPGHDRHLAARAEIGLASRVGLHRRDRHPEKIAHARTAKIATKATTITTMSVTSFS
jgi:hypothetical protein